MNKQELIGKYEGKRNKNLSFELLNAYIDFIRDLQQLDEQQKVTIPHFVADWLKLSKSIGRSLFGAMRVFEKDDDVEKWLQWSENQELFARAWLDGYEVEEEKRYTVVMKETKQPLYYNAGDKKLFFSLSSLATHFTRKQLEYANFGWVFDCEGVEVEEVE